MAPDGDRRAPVRAPPTGGAVVRGISRLPRKGARVIAPGAASLSGSDDRPRRRHRTSQPRRAGALENYPMPWDSSGGRTSPMAAGGRSPSDKPRSSGRSPNTAPDGAREEGPGSLPVEPGRGRSRRLDCERNTARLQPVDHEQWPWAMLEHSFLIVEIGEVDTRRRRRRGRRRRHLSIEVYRDAASRYLRTTKASRLVRRPA